MSALTKEYLQQKINELKDYALMIHKQYGDDKDYKHIKGVKEFLIDKKIEETIDEMLNINNEKVIDFFVFEKGNDNVLSNELLLEWEQYKKIPKTKLTYRFDKGRDQPGFLDHIHVYLGKTKNQIYAINIDGSPHDGSKARLSKHEINFLKKIGFTPPENGILEWITLDNSKEYYMYKRSLLLG
jgi:hypothetical protein